MKVVLSKTQWYLIGKIAGWIREAGISPVKLPYDVLISRLKHIGWKEKPVKNAAHVMMIDPTGKNIITIGKHNYEHKHHEWKTVMGTILRGNHNLRFIFLPEFNVPDNFDIKTQTIKEHVAEEHKPKYLKVPFSQIPIGNSYIFFNNQ